MILSENEAKKRWCHATRTLLGDLGKDGVYKFAKEHPIHNQIVDTASGVPDKYRNRCIASGCMSWRWAIGDGAPQIKTHGYCGLAGKP